MGVVTNQATATIANGATTSAPFYVGAKTPFSLQMPAAFTGATISFLGSMDNVTYLPVYVAGALYSETVVEGTNLTLAQPDELRSYPFLKIVSASDEGAARTILVNTRAIR